jgi:predicted nucleic acid-binding protein
MRARFDDRVLAIDEAVADTWARLSLTNPLPMLDGLLAATALTRSLVLVTRNVADVARTGESVLNPFSDRAE